MAPTPTELLLEGYQRLWLRPDSPAADQQSGVWRRMGEFLASHPDVYLRSHPVGHFTGSALVVDESLARVALHLHKKLGMWMQFGGHADGDPRLDRVALREAEEESHLQGLEFLAYEAGLDAACAGPVPFDVDIHPIPAWRDEPAHLHYDVNFLLLCRLPETLRLSPESEAVAWFTLEEARQRCPEEKLQREFRKIEWLRALRQEVRALF